MTVTMQHHIHAPQSEGGKPSASGALGATPTELVTNRNQTVSPTALAIEDTLLDAFDPIAMPNTVSNSSMASGNWGSPSPSPDPSSAASGGGPMMVQSFPPNATGSPVGFAQSGIQVSGTQDGGSPTGSPGVSASAPATEDETAGGQTNRRQKRLERNRESARLSRRRRKQYLEVLEDRVKQLSLEMDKGRRDHVALAVSTLQEKRFQALQTHSLAALETTLSRTSSELRVAGTFQTQQLQSLVFAPHAKFLLWLSLQSDTYFRGGRAASERLSAARIGERMLGSGNDRVPPAQGMWPLLCNEVGLSYDQEERIRSVQRAIVQTPETWLDRHTGAASSLVMQSAHDCVQALQHRIGERERGVMSVLTDEQRLKLLQWAARNQERLRTSMNHEAPKEVNDGYSLSPSNHAAANLYIVNHRLQMALNKLPTPPALVVGATVKRLSRRPSFESLGSTGSLSERGQKDESRGLSRESSFSSTGSLKRSLAELEMDDERAQSQSVSVEEAEVVAKPTVDAALGFVEGIMPLLRPQPAPDNVTSFSPAVNEGHASMTMQGQARAQPFHPAQQFLQPNPQAVTSDPAAFATQQRQGQEEPMSSFLPQPLNAVPEEGFNSNDPADDFLFELAEEDWAIGEGFEMDTT